MHLRLAQGVLHQRVWNAVDIYFQGGTRRFELGPEFQPVPQVPAYTVHQVKNVTFRASQRYDSNRALCMEGPAAPDFALPIQSAVTAMELILG